MNVVEIIILYFFILSAERALKPSSRFLKNTIVEVDTTTDKIEFFFKSVVPRHHSQLAVLPPCMFANVAAET